MWPKGFDSHKVFLSIQRFIDKLSWKHTIQHLRHLQIVIVPVEISGLILSICFYFDKVQYVQVDHESIN